jgi:hypothetical protein
MDWDDCTDFNEENHQAALKIITELADARDKKNCQSLWQRVSKILTHDHWYTTEDYVAVRNAAKCSQGLTAKQRKTATTLKPEEERENFTMYCEYDGPDDPDRYLGHGEFDTAAGYTTSG